MAILLPRQLPHKNTFVQEKNALDIGTLMDIDSYSYPKDYLTYQETLIEHDVIHFIMSINITLSINETLKY